MKSETKFGMIKKTSVCISVVAAGFLVMMVMGKMKEPPVEKQNNETALQVDIMRAEIQDVRLTLSGFGEVQSLNTVNLSPEVSGIVSDINPTLEEGAVIPEGDVLFRIDSDDYETSVETYGVRKKALQSNLKLSTTEYIRIKNLYEKSNTGTLSDVESAERAMNTATDTLSQIIKLYRDAEKNLERCTVRAPFNARIKSVSLEKDQFVSTGSSVLSIADDSVLEIVVPVDTGEALMVLDFEKGDVSQNDISWFDSVKPMICRVVWSESRKTITADGYLHRVVNYGSTSRTVSLAVRIENQRGQKNEISAFPIVDGMFCQVVIPGRILKDVIRVPEHAVSFDGKVKLSANSRLKTVPVDVVWKEGGYSLISAGLSTGDTVITTRLSSPLENRLLDSTKTDMVADRIGADLL